jgi:hypothetical protein
MVCRAEKADDGAPRIHRRVQTSIGASESVTCVENIVLRSLNMVLQAPRLNLFYNRSVT